MSVILPCCLRQCRAPLSAALVAISLLVGGCAGQPADKTGVDVVRTPSDTSSPSTSESAVAKDAAFQLLKQAETAASPQRESLLLQASAYYQQQGDYTRMGRVLQEIHAENLPDDLRIRYSLQYGDWAITQRHLADADSVLLDARLNTGLEAADAAQLHGLRSRLYELESKPIDALNERMTQSLLVPEAGQREVCDATWRVLSQLSPTDIEFLESADTSNRAEEQLMAGWLALARIQRNDTGNIDKQVADVKDWQRSYPVHPANRFMPADMAMTADGGGKQTQRIALLLPLTGKRASAGQALRDGFMTMHYKQLAGGNADVQIDLVDSSASPDILNIYNNAVAQGAQLVIGPLEREQVQVLAAQSSLPVPTLALNNPLQGSSQSAVDSTGLYQFSLNPEDDVVQVANAAAASRLHKALVIAPQGERGERLVQAFLRSWPMVGGETVGQMRYAPGTGNYSVQLADVLGIDLASGKMRPGKTLPDVVFFVGTGIDASVMMETLARNGGGSLPVYATAQVLAGQSPDQRANGLRVCVAPWQAGSGPLRTEGVTATSTDTDMLFAMGADAQALYTRLTMLDGNPSLHVPGNTGYLSMDTRHRVIRTLVLGVMQDGQLQVQAASGHF